MKPTLMGMPGSPFVRKARVCLLEKGVDFADEFVNIFPVPVEFARINPMKRVPVLRFEHEGETVHLADTSAIAQYLERTVPDPPLFPPDPVGHARAMMWEEVADTNLAALIGLGVFRPLVTSQFTGKPVDHARVRRTLEVKLPELYDALEALLGDQDYFLGTLSIVDVSVATQFANLHHAGQRVDATRWPGLAAHIDRLLARPSFVACLAKETMIPPPIALQPVG